MVLYDWIAEYILPLFGVLPTEPLDLGFLGTLTIENIFQVIFWTVLGVILVDLLVILPYQWINKLCGRGRRKK